MEWTTPTYQGVYMGGEPSRVRTAVFEIARGVREREDAVGAPATEFYRADGTPTTDLTMEDLAPLYAGGLDDMAGAGNIVWANLRAAVDAIRTLVGNPLPTGIFSGQVWAFATDETFSTLYTLEIIFGGGSGLVEIEDELGINLSISGTGNLWGPTGLPRDLTDHRYFQYLQDALNALRFARIVDVPEKVITGTQSSVPGDDPMTFEEAWAARNSVPKSTPVTGLFGFNHDMGWLQFNFGGYRVFMGRQCESTYSHIANIQGDLLSAEVVVLRSALNRVSPVPPDLDPIPLTFGLNGVSFLVDESNRGETSMDVTEQLTLGEAFVVEGQVLTLEPGTNPFTFYSSGTGLSVDRLIAFLDITSLLSNLSP